MELFYFQEALGLLLIRDLYWNFSSMLSLSPALETAGRRRARIVEEQIIGISA
jgi:hypothetical protein